MITVDNTFEKINKSIKERIIKNLDIKTYFAGRLANYTYINQDQAIIQKKNLHLLMLILNVIKNQQKKN